MDSDKFDKLAKALTNDTTRRGVLGGLAGILASVVGAGSAEAGKRAKHGRGGKSKCPKDKCNCGKCKCKSGADCATGCCHKGYCCPKRKCKPKPPCPTECPTDYCGDLEVPEGCPPVTCECPEGYRCKDDYCVPCECTDEHGHCEECPPECPTECPTDYCGDLEVPEGCPPVDCPCPKGYRCKDDYCVKCKCVNKYGHCKECPPECPTECPTDYCGDLEVPKGCPPVTCECPKGYKCKDDYCVPCECTDEHGHCEECPPECPTECPTDYCGDLEVPEGCPPVTCECPKGYKCKDDYCVKCKCTDKYGHCKECRY